MRQFNPDDIVRFLNQLRLKGIGEAFIEQLEQAISQQVGIVEFMGNLFYDELEQRKQRRFERMLKEGNLGMNDCLQNYDFDLAQEHGLQPKTIRDLVPGGYIVANQNIVLAGAVGTGKTQLAKTLGFEAVRRGFRVRFATARDLVDELFTIKDSYIFPKVYRRLVRMDLIILDDLGYLPTEPEKVDFLFRLIFDRTEQKKGSFIVTTNTDVKSWWSFFPNKAMGMAFSDRILGGAMGIKFTGDSIRSKGKKQQDEDL